MNLNNLICCNNTNFNRTKDFYICLECGKKYKKKMILYNNQDLTEQRYGKLRMSFKGRKVYKLSSQSIGVLDKNEYKNINIDNFIETQNYNMTNLALDIMQNEKFIIEKTANKKTIIYNLKNNEIIETIRNKYELIGIVSNSFLCYFDNRIFLYNLETNKEIQIFDFCEQYEENFFCKIKNIDMNYNKNRIMIFYVCRNDTTSLCGSILVNFENEIYCENAKWKRMYECVTYDFEKNKYYATYDGKLMEIINANEENIILVMPKLISILDGGIKTPEFFNECIKKMKIFYDRYFLIYDSSIVVINAINKTPCYCFSDNKHNLIQSFDVIDSNTICFSSGNKVYLVTIDVL